MNQLGHENRKVLAKELRQTPKMIVRSLGSKGSTEATAKTLEQIRESALSLADEGKVQEALELVVSALEAVMRMSRELKLLVLKLRRERVGKCSDRVHPAQFQLLEPE